MGDDLAYGCLFCRTGSERMIAELINAQIDDISAAIPIKIRKRYHDGECQTEKVLLLPGYVLFKSKPEAKVKQLEEITHVHRILKYADASWILKGLDLEFAAFFFESSEIEYSKAEFVDGHIHFIDGFLKGHDDDVVRLNKRMKTAEVKLGICDSNIWIGYEEVERKPAKM